MEGRLEEGQRWMAKLEERSGWRRLVTPCLTRTRPIYNWFIFPHSFDKQLVQELLAELRIGPGQAVWDPFVGAGTTVLACKELGISAYGTDLLPISVLVSRAKICDYHPDALNDALNSFTYRIRSGTQDRFADVAIVHEALPPRIRLRISSLLEQIETLDEPAKLFFTVALIGILENLSYTVKSGGWLRLDLNKRVSEKDVKSLFVQSASMMLDHVRTVARSRVHPFYQTVEGGTSSHVDVWIGDARFEQLPQPVDAVITSPPYLNRHDYTRVFALELALVAVNTNQELKELRYQTLRSHVEARAPKQIKPDGYKPPVLLNKVLEAIETRGVNNTRILETIRGYFEDIYHVLTAIRENLKPGGVAALVLGNTRFSGVMIPVDLIVAEMGQNVRLEPEKIIVARYRGNSAQQMGVYGREEARESVIIFRKS